MYLLFSNLFRRPSLRLGEYDDLVLAEECVSRVFGKELSFSFNSSVAVMEKISVVKYWALHQIIVISVPF